MIKPIAELTKAQVKVIMDRTRPTLALLEKGFFLLDIIARARPAPPNK